MKRLTTITALVGSLLTAGAFGVACSTSHTRHDDTMGPQLGASTAKGPDKPIPIASAKPLPPPEQAPPLSPGATQPTPVIVTPAQPAPNPTPTTQQPPQQVPVPVPVPPVALPPPPPDETPAPPPTGPQPAPGPTPSPTPPVTMPAPTQPPSMMPMQTGMANDGGVGTPPPPDVMVLPDATPGADAAPMFRDAGPTIPQPITGDARRF